MRASHRSRTPCPIVSALLSAMLATARGGGDKPRSGRVKGLWQTPDKSKAHSVFMPDKVGNIKFDRLCHNHQCKAGTPWRVLAANVISQRANDPSLTDIYEWGVFTGGSLMMLRYAWAHFGLNRTLNKVWAFDSFVGLQPGAKTAGDDFDWNDGAFSSSKFFATRSQSEIIDKLQRVITGKKTLENARRDWFGSKLSFIPGFFNESLHHGLARERQMRPALYVDVDVDQYLPTIQLLDWMLAEGLIRPGTFIGYDDIGSTDKWTAGESKAQLEVARKYNVRFELAYNMCRKVSSNHPNRQRGDDSLCPKLAGCRRSYFAIFRVVAIHDARGAAMC